MSVLDNYEVVELPEDQWPFGDNVLWVLAPPRDRWFMLQAPSPDGEPTSQANNAD